MTYRCELCQKGCRLIDFNYISEETITIRRCEPEKAFVSFKIKGCKKVHHLGLFKKDSNRHLDPFKTDYYI